MSRLSKAAGILAGIIIPELIIHLITGSGSLAETIQIQIRGLLSIW